MPPRANDAAISFMTSRRSKPPSAAPSGNSRASWARNPGVSASSSRLRQYFGPVSSRSDAAPFDGLTARASAELLEFVRGGETAAGARRTILITGQELPAVIHRRIERTYRLTRAGTLELEPA
jgi:hypothetical protein